MSGPVSDEARLGPADASGATAMTRVAAAAHKTILIIIRISELTDREHRNGNGGSGGERNE